MISYIEGELLWVTENSLVISCNGLGYEVFVPMTVLEKQPRPGSTQRFYTYLQVKEDGVALFGFASRDELEVFRLLISVNGIGPKGAVGILSGISAENLRYAVLSEDEKTIAKAPGIGPKTAKKVILELKDKFRLQDVFEQSFGEHNGTTGETAGAPGVVAEAIQALTALGFSNTEASRAVHAVDYRDGMTSDDLLKQALKNM